MYFTPPHSRILSTNERNLLNNTYIPNFNLGKIVDPKTLSNILLGTRAMKLNLL